MEEKILFQLKKKKVESVYSDEFSFDEFKLIYNHPMETICPILLQTLSDKEYFAMPIVKLAHRILEILRDHEGAKLTKKGEKVLQDIPSLFRELFTVFSTQLDWGSTDGYGNSEIGFWGNLYSYYLLAKYGDEAKPASFFVDHYFQDYPIFSADEHAIRCYIFRTFEKYGFLWGFNTDCDYFQHENKTITATPVVRKLFGFL